MEYPVASKIRSVGFESIDLSTGGLFCCRLPCFGNRSWRHNDFEILARDALDGICSPILMVCVRAASALFLSLRSFVSYRSGSWTGIWWMGCEFWLSWKAMGADVEQYDASVGKVCLSQLFKLFQYSSCLISSTHISLTSAPIHWHLACINFVLQHRRGNPAWGSGAALWARCDKGVFSMFTYCLIHTYY